MSGVMLLNKIPDLYEQIGLRTSLSHTKIGPCILLYDRTIWNAWDEPFWRDTPHGGRMRPAQPGYDDPCPRCGQPVDCLNQGPGALAVWIGALAQAITQGINRADEEEALALHWAKFCEFGDITEVCWWRPLAEYINGSTFRGFVHLPDHYRDWQDFVEFTSPNVWGEGLSRGLHLPIILALLRDLGVIVPDIPSSKKPNSLEIARSGAETLLRRHQEDRIILMAKIRSRTPLLQPKYTPPPITDAEYFAEALMGYDHYVGEARSWGPFGRSKLGHNRPPD
jgi:hypothetical protein